ncbi:MAG: hypothetical protein DHS20C17_35940 [Cyclobacteriaceae bacterium]|nr:MAG: hypothetical protein DHS20C17_35940 [Cyclobacteriaceae bacterium]
MPTSNSPAEVNVRQPMVKAHGASDLGMPQTFMLERFGAKVMEI